MHAIVCPGIAKATPLHAIVCPGIAARVRRVVSVEKTARFLGPEKQCNLARHFTTPTWVLSKRALNFIPFSVLNKRPEIALSSCPWDQAARSGEHTGAEQRMERFENVCTNKDNQRCKRHTSPAIACATGHASWTYPQPAMSCRFRRRSPDHQAHALSRRLVPCKALALP